MATRVSAPSPTLRDEVAPHPEPPVPIKVWATLGAVCLAIIAFVWTKWLIGPFTETVSTGPTPVPDWMKTVLIVTQVAIVSGAIWCFWHFLIQPWRRERRLSTDGILCIAFMLVWFQDPLTNWFSPWITWNSYLVNIGGWTHEIPGWISWGEPGAMVPEPVPFAPALYVCVWMGLTLGGCALMRWARARWPQAGPFRLFGLVFAVMFVADVVIEGLIFMPLGFWTYSGGPVPIMFPDSHHALPLHEPLFIGLMMATYASLRYYRDDRGHTLVERGVERIRGTRKQNAARVLALIGAVQLIFLITFTVPVSFIGANSREWPEDTQKRSYLTDNLCGVGTDRECKDLRLEPPRVIAPDR